MIYKSYLSEKFTEDGLYPAPKHYLLDTVSKHLKPIEYDRWAKLYWKRELERVERIQRHKWKIIEDGGV